MDAINLKVPSFRVDKASQPTLADTYAKIKQFFNQADQALKELKEEFVKRGLDALQGKFYSLKVTHVNGGLRYDSKKLDSYFKKVGLNPNKFKSEQAEQTRVTIVA